jgi:23S rRNA (uracil1939-C5)-methyltransferase
MVIGVSGNPATFARDARILVDSGYDLNSVAVVDQLNGSHHVELVAFFYRGLCLTSQKRRSRSLP